MVITGSIVGALLPDSSTLIHACGAKDLIENTNESQAHVRFECACNERMWIFGLCSIRQRARVCECVRVINP